MHGKAEERNGDKLTAVVKLDANGKNVSRVLLSLGRCSTLTISRTYAYICHGFIRHFCCQSG